MHYVRTNIGIALRPIVGVYCEPVLDEGTEALGDVVPNSVEFGLEFRTQCLPGLFFYSGSSSRICQQDGTFSDYPLRCYDSCKTLKCVNLIN